MLEASHHDFHRTAAFLLAIRRVGEAALSRGGTRESIDLG
jgi:hypothetical protein